MVWHDRHYAVAKKVMEILKAERFDGFNPKDIRIEDFPFKVQPVRGIVISPLDEEQAVGTNTNDDVRYKVQVSRILPKPSNIEGLRSRSVWRYAIRDLFNRKRIGVDTPGGCEIVTGVEFSTIKIPRLWDSWSVDASVCIVSCLIREPRST
jgi:hypothetical protein